MLLVGKFWFLNELCCFVCCKKIHEVFFLMLLRWSSHLCKGRAIPNAWIWGLLVYFAMPWGLTKASQKASKTPFCVFRSKLLPFLATVHSFPYYMIRKTTLGMRDHKFFWGKQNERSASHIKFTNTKHIYVNFQQDSFRDRQVKASYFWTLFWYTLYVHRGKIKNPASMPQKAWKSCWPAARGRFCPCASTKHS